MNNINIIGNMTQDPKEGKGWAQFSVAVNGYEKGEKTVIYFDCVAFGKTAEAVGKFTQKGAKVGVSGRVSVSDKGKYRIIANEVDFLSPKAKASEDAEEQLPFEV